jgi:hypothetical protein
MTPHTQPNKPVLSPANIGEALLRLQVATDDELRQWDRRLPAEIRRFNAERARQVEAA